MTSSPEHESLCDQKWAEVDIQPLHVAAIFLGALLPNAVLVLAFSDLGAGLAVYTAVAPTSMSLTGDACCMSFAITVCIYYIFDWMHWAPKLKGASLIVPWLFGVLGCVLKGRKYPWAPILVTVVHVCLLLGALRCTVCSKVMRYQFYKAACASTLVLAGVLLMIFSSWALDGNEWDDLKKDQMAGRATAIYESLTYYVDPPRPERSSIVYVDHCSPERNTSYIEGLPSEPQAELSTNCNTAESVLFLVWACPIAGFFSNFAIAIFVFLNGVMLDLTDASKLEHVLKRCIMGLTLALMGMYLSTSIAGASFQLGSTLMAFFAASLGALLGWALMELSSEMVGAFVDSVNSTGLPAKMLGFCRIDWVQAGILGGFGLLMAVFLSLESLRQAYTGKGKASGGATDKFTVAAKFLSDEVGRAHWTNVLLKLCILSEVFFTFQVGVAKVTYIFLSWLNVSLGPEGADLHYGITIMVVFIIGYTMFLLPPVPGIPVYVFCGVVVAEQVRVGTGSFPMGCIISIFLGWILKLCACVGQYMIGFGLGKGVKVQQLIGVDKVPTRAVEQILKTRGLSVGKVSVLVGGPDWPVSVTCGILKLNIPQMILGTAPVFFVLMPCVLAGAFLAQAGKDGENGAPVLTWNTLASLFMAVSAVVQGASGFLAMYSIMQVVEGNHDELAKPRQEHEAVAALTRQEQTLNDTARRVSSWENLGTCRRATVLSAAGLLFFSCTIFAFLGGECFEEFSVSSNITETRANGGLDGNVFLLLKDNGSMPYLGHFSGVLFCMGVLLHIVFSQDMSRAALHALAREGPYDASSGASGASPDVIGATDASTGAR